jgi:hypothetical protein
VLTWMGSYKVPPPLEGKGEKDAVGYLPSFRLSIFMRAMTWARQSYGTVDACNSAVAM